MKTKKIILLTTVMALSLTLAGCGGGDKPATTPPATTPPATAPATPAPAPTATNAPDANAEDVVYTLDYDIIASWVDAGFIGQDESGSPVVMAIDAANETAIIIFGDNSDMTAASFVGAITYDDTTGTITDEANGSTLTFGVVQVDDTTLELDMGDIGKATIKAVSKEEVLKTLKTAIENYEHIV